MDTTISSLIAVAESGDRSANDALFALLYEELHRIARGQLARSSGEVTLGTTTLLHEAYLDLAARERLSFPDRGRFMAYASRAMRGLIIDSIRSRRAQKRGGLFEITAIEQDVRDPGADDRELQQISDELGALDPTLVQVVDLKFFCGFSFAEIAAMEGQSERTIQRRWEKARIWLHHALGGSN